MISSTGRMTLLALATAMAASPAMAETRRLAIVVGSNAGAGDLPPLRFAESDAGKMARVLVELGDVLPDDVMLLQGRPMLEVERAIGEARERVNTFKRSPDVRTVLAFYFSGHSDGESIELGNEKLAYARLKALLAGTGADVRLTIIDACRSGGGLQEKGGKAAPGFSIRLADTLQATGEAFITSSAADEAALESSEVMGSYFTHNLISGLRGAADTSGDKVVTLAEAYRYAYDRTVSSTALLAVGAQHPNYDFRLAGQGELVLSTLLRPSSLLVLPEADRSLVTDLTRDQVVVELVSSGGREVALLPGQYGVRVFKGGQAFGGRVTLAEGQRQVISISALSPVASSVVVAAKGGVSTVTRVAEPSRRSGVGLGVSLGGTGRVLAEGTNHGPKWQLRAEVEPLTTRFWGNDAVHLSGSLHVLALGEASFDADTATVPGANEAGGQLRLGYRLALDAWRFQLGVGVEGGPGFLAQLYAPHASTLTVSLAPRAFLRFRLTDALSIALSAELTFTGLNYEATPGQAAFSWFAYPSLAAGVAIKL